MNVYKPSKHSVIAAVACNTLYGCTFSSLEFDRIRAPYYCYKFQEPSPSPVCQTMQVLNAAGARSKIFAGCVNLGIAIAPKHSIHHWIPKIAFVKAWSDGFNLQPQLKHPNNFLIWGFPKMGVPPTHPFQYRNFPYRPSIFGYPIYGNPHMLLS